MTVSSIAMLGQQHMKLSPYLTILLHSWAVVKTVPFGGMISGLNQGKTLDTSINGYDKLIRSFLWFCSCFKQRCKDDIVISCQRAITALAISPTNTFQLGVGCADSTVKIYDTRYLSSQAGGSR